MSQSLVPSAPSPAALLSPGLPRLVLLLLCALVLAMQPTHIHGWPCAGLPYFPSSFPSSFGVQTVMLGSYTTLTGSPLSFSPYVPQDSGIYSAAGIVLWCSNNYHMQLRCTQTSWYPSIESIKNYMVTKCMNVSIELATPSITINNSALASNLWDIYLAHDLNNLIDPIFTSSQPLTISLQFSLPQSFDTFSILIHSVMLPTMHGSKYDTLTINSGNLTVAYNITTSAPFARLVTNHQLQFSFTIEPDIFTYDSHHLNVLAYSPEPVLEPLDMFEFLPFSDPCTTSSSVCLNGGMCKISQFSVIDVPIPSRADAGVHITCSCPEGTLGTRCETGVIYAGIVRVDNQLQLTLIGWGLSFIHAVEATAHRPVSLGSLSDEQDALRTFGNNTLTQQSINTTLSATEFTLRFPELAAYYGNSSLQAASYNLSSTLAQQLQDSQVFHLTVLLNNPFDAVEPPPFPLLYDEDKHSYSKDNARFLTFSSGRYMGSNPCDFGRVRVSSESPYFRCNPDDALKYCERCPPCPPDSLCRGDNMIFPPIGQWNDALITLPLQCRRTFACKGALDKITTKATAALKQQNLVTTIINQCNEGYEGRGCSLCANNYYSMSARCYQCDTPPNEQTQLTFNLVATLLFLLLSSYIIVSSAVQSSISRLYSYMNLLFCLQLIIFVGKHGHVEADSSASSSTSISRLVQFFNFFSFILVDIEWLKGGCAFRYLHPSHEIWATYILCILYGFIMIAISTVLFMWKSRFAKSADKQVSTLTAIRNFVCFIVLLSYLQMSSLSWAMFQASSCVRLISVVGGSTLSILPLDMSVDCWNVTHTVGFVFALLTIVVFILPIPIGAFFLIWIRPFQKTNKIVESQTAPILQVIPSNEHQTFNENANALEVSRVAGRKTKSKGRVLMRISNIMEEKKTQADSSDHAPEPSNSTDSARSATEPPLFISPASVEDDEEADLSDMPAPVSPQRSPSFPHYFSYLFAAANVNVDPLHSYLLIFPLFLHFAIAIVDGLIVDQDVKLLVMCSMFFIVILVYFIHFRAFQSFVTPSFVLFQTISWSIAMFLCILYLYCMSSTAFMWICIAFIVVTIVLLIYSSRFLQWYTQHNALFKKSTVKYLKHHRRARSELSVVGSQFMSQYASQFHEDHEQPHEHEMEASRATPSEIHRDIELSESNMNNLNEVFGDEEEPHEKHTSVWEFPED